MDGWSDGDRLYAFLQLDTCNTSVVDLLGNGCACLMWARPLSASGQTLQYIDLMNGRKPFLLEGYTNDLGLETKVSYTLSTASILIGRGMEICGLHTRNSEFNVWRRRRCLTTLRYAYRHDFYDRKEREFRGFEMVEQWDTENLSSTSSLSFPGATNMEETYSVPATRNKTWFHTGAYM